MRAIRLADTVLRCIGSHMSVYLFSLTSKEDGSSQVRDGDSHSHTPSKWDRYRETDWKCMEVQASARCIIALSCSLSFTDLVESLLLTQKSAYLGTHIEMSNAFDVSVDHATTRTRFRII